MTAVKETSDLSGKSVKEVEDLLDLTPVLTEELMDLSSWLSDKTLSFKITALQAMLPAALKAKYEKELKIAHGADLPPQVERLFSETKTLLYSDIPDHDTLKLIQRHVQKGDIDVTYKVAQKTNKKMVRHIQANASKEELAKQAEDCLAKQQNSRRFFTFSSLSRKV